MQSPYSEASLRHLIRSQNSHVHYHYYRSSPVVPDLRQMNRFQKHLRYLQRNTESRPVYKKNNILNFCWCRDLIYLLDDKAVRWQFWTVWTCCSGNEKDRPSPKFCIYKTVVCKLPDFSNLFAKSMHVDWPLNICSRILPVLVFVTVHFMYGK